MRLLRLLYVCLAWYPAWHGCGGERGRGRRTPAPKFIPGGIRPFWTLIMGGAGDKNFEGIPLSGIQGCRCWVVSRSICISQFSCHLQYFEGSLRSILAGARQEAKHSNKPDSMSIHSLLPTFVPPDISATYCNKWIIGDLSFLYILVASTIRTRYGV